RELTAGENGYAQLRLESPVVALPGDRFILRSYSPASTIGGGLVLDAHPAKHRLRDSGRVTDYLAPWRSAPDDVERVALLIEGAADHGMSESEIARSTGATDEEIKHHTTALVETGRVVRMAANPPLFVVKASADDLAKRILTRLAEFHKESPLERGMGREEMRERLFSRLRPELFRGVVEELARRAAIVIEKDSLRLSSHRVELSPEDLAARTHLAEIFEGAGLQPISLDQAVAQAGMQFAIAEPRARKFAQMLLSSGELV